MYSRLPLPCLMASLILGASAAPASFDAKKLPGPQQSGLPGVGFPFTGGNGFPGINNPGGSSGLGGSKASSAELFGAAQTGSVTSSGQTGIVASSAPTVTGSGDFWLPHDEYDPAGKKLVQGDVWWNVSYADGAGANGTRLVYDDITAENGYSSLLIPNQIIQYADQSRAKNDTEAETGVIGLRQQYSGDKVYVGSNVWVDDQRRPNTPLYQSAGFDSFTTHFDTSGEMYIAFGEEGDDDEYLWAPSNPTEANWRLADCDTYKIAGNTVANPNVTTPTMLDTGNTLISLDPKTVAEIYNAVKGSYRYTFGGESTWLVPCDTPASALPKVQLPWGKAGFVDVNMDAFIQHGVHDGNNNCGGYIQEETGMIVYGTLLFRSGKVKFVDDRQGKLQVGFSKF